MARAQYLTEGEEEFVAEFLHSHPDYMPIDHNGQLVMVPCVDWYERYGMANDYVVPDAPEWNCYKFTLQMPPESCREMVN